MDHKILSTMKCILYLFSLLVLALPAQAASFDCKNAHLTDIEIQICADENVSAQDEKLASLYRKLQAGATASQREALKADQQQWLHDVRNACSYRDCLGNAYRARIESMEELNLDGWQTWVSEKEAFAELSRRSSMSESGLTELFRDNGYTQLAMNFGSFGSFIAVDLKMGKMLAQKIASLPPSCHSTLQANQAKWQALRDRKCNKEADDEAEGGSMRPMIFTTCQAISTRERIVYLRSLKSCEALR